MGHIQFEKKQKERESEASLSPEQILLNVSAPWEIMIVTQLFSTDCVKWC